MVLSFREELYLQLRKVVLADNAPTVSDIAEQVQAEASSCCLVWGHEFDIASDLMSKMAEIVPQTQGGTPVVSNRKCSRCGHVPKPGELRRLP
jgi:hypothetical protein